MMDQRFYCGIRCCLKYGLMVKFGASFVLEFAFQRGEGEKREGVQST